MKKVSYQVKTHVPWRILICTDHGARLLGAKWMEKVRKSSAGKDKLLITHIPLEKPQLNLFRPLFLPVWTVPPSLNRKLRMLDRCPMLEFSKYLLLHCSEHRELMPACVKYLPSFSFIFFSPHNTKKRVKQHLKCACKIRVAVSFPSDWVTMCNAKSYREEKFWPFLYLRHGEIQQYWGFRMVFISFSGSFFILELILGFDWFFSCLCWLRWFGK